MQNKREAYHETLVQGPYVRVSRTRAGSALILGVKSYVPFCRLPRLEPKADETVMKNKCSNLHTRKSSSFTLFQ
ncbi:hypothetical protein BgiBS90_033325, partial [Biomphalaria glabrata]